MPDADNHGAPPPEMVDSTSDDSTRYAWRMTLLAVRSSLVRRWPAVSMGRRRPFLCKGTDMDNLFSIGTSELLNDAAVNALDDTRNAGMPDWEAREKFVKAAGLAFDMIAAELQARVSVVRPEFLG